MESSYPAQAKDNALLRSPWLNPISGGQCLKFCYTMYGNTMGQLKVHIEKEGVAKYLIFYESGDKGVGWKGFEKDIDTNLRYRVSETWD